MALTIGSITLKHGLMLAPMAGFTDRTFRRLCVAHGAEFTVSEMVCAKALCYEQRSRKPDGEAGRSGTLAAVLHGDNPMALQLFGGEPDFMAEAVAMICENRYKGNRSEEPPAVIDINMGCPVHKIVANGEGSALMKDPDRAGRVAEAAVKAAGGRPVTVKIRAGWDDGHRNAVEVAQILASAGVSAICVHGRTRSQQYAGRADRAIIAAVKQAVSVPVIANGDITNAAEALSMLRETGCDGLMIGRGALGNPWIFEEIAAAMENRPFCPPDRAAIVQTALLHLHGSVEEKGERVGLAEAKKQMSHYLRGFDGAAEARGRIYAAETLKEAEAVFLSLTLTLTLSEGRDGAREERGKSPFPVQSI
ncbi:MAG: tRNA dihydrouridine synthase DusB [Clostridia bacterium]|nr:tRNA dihydrouridine synthase DusB [Clostridia bacterium]